MLEFGTKCIKPPTLKRLFPVNAAIADDPHRVRNQEPYHVTDLQKVKKILQFFFWMRNCHKKAHTF